MRKRLANSHLLPAWSNELAWRGEIEEDRQ